MAKLLQAERLANFTETLPTPPQSYDLVTSNLYLHWINDLPGMLVQLRQCLRPDGLFIGSLVGGTTLQELRDCLYRAEQSITGGFANRFSPLTEVRDMGGLLQRAGFALPVADREIITVTYPHPLKLLHDLRGMAATNIAPQRHPLRRDVLNKALELYITKYTDSEGRLPATFEIIFLSGWAPHESQPQPLPRGTGKISLKDALKS